MNIKKIPKRLSEVSLRDLLQVILPALLLLIAGFWLAAQFIRPAPPDKLILTTGGEGDSYQYFAKRYKKILARYDIELIEKPSAGSLENLQRLRDDNFEVDVGFFQSGTAQVSEDDALVSLGSLYYDPLWIFYRDGLLKRTAKAGAKTVGELGRIAQLKGLRIAIGETSSGTHKLAMELLAANGIAGKPTRLTKEEGEAAASSLLQGKVDAVFLVGSMRAPAVRKLLLSKDVRLMDMTQGETYVRRFSYLAKLTLPQGAVDLARNIPPRDVTLISPMAMLLAREDTHPAIISLLLQAASEVHGSPSIFRKPGEFPHASQIDFPMSSEAERYYKSGKPFLQRYLPFWAATLIDRMVVMLVPVFALLIPIIKFAPGIYNWRVRSRIYRRYGELKFIEAEMELEPQRHTRAEWLAKLDDIEADANSIPTPLAFADMLYTLRSHIDLVREAILRRTPTALPDSNPP